MCLFIYVCIHLFTYLYLFVHSFIYSYCDNSQLLACFKTGSILWYDEVPSHPSTPSGKNQFSHNPIAI